MGISTVKLQKDGGYLVNGSLSVPNTPGNRHYQQVQEWIALGNTPDPYVPPPDPTLDEIYSQALQNSRVLKALVLCINDGSIVPGANASKAALKAAIKAKM